MCGSVGGGWEVRWFERKGAEAQRRKGLTRLDVFGVLGGVGVGFEPIAMIAKMATRAWRLCVFAYCFFCSSTKGQVFGLCRGSALWYSTDWLTAQFARRLTQVRCMSKLRF